MNHKIVRVSEHGRCSVDFAAEFDIAALRNLATKALVEPKPGQPNTMSDERRTCLTQVLLAEVAFAKREGIPVSEIRELPF